MSKILFVEDDDDIRDSYAALLTGAGFDMLAVSNKVAALDQFKSFQPDLVLLDIVLEDDADAGFDICAELREVSETLPIIFLTSLDSDFDKIFGMRLGADDYITKDISIEYLLVRIKALLRRVDILSGRIDAEKKRLELDDLTIDLDILTASWKGGLLNLNVTQIWMLHALARSPNQICSVKQLMDAANVVVQSNTVAVHMMNVRKAFLGIDADFDTIKNERGLGYRWLRE